MNNHANLDYARWHVQKTDNPNHDNEVIAIIRTLVVSGIEFRVYVTEACGSECTKIEVGET